MLRFACISYLKYPYLPIPKTTLLTKIRPFNNPSHTIATMDSRYHNAHKSPKGPGDARPTALDIVKDENLEGKLSDQIVLITGCSSGIGIETARAMTATGAKVFCGVRDISKGQSALSDILKPGHVELLEMDLNSLGSIKKAAEEFKNKSEALNILINNAGRYRCLMGTIHELATDAALQV